MPKLAPKRLFGRRRPADTLQLRIERGDVADILPSDLPPSRSLEADKAELTRIIETYAAAGGIDRATGGHLLDEMIDSWHRDQVKEINRVFLTREAAADRLIGTAEARHQQAREQLGYAADRYKRHAAAAERARAALIGEVPDADLPHSTVLDQAAARDLPHDRDCLTPAAWSAPWQEDPRQEETFPGNTPKGTRR
jgi:hypothetical protein